MPNIGQLAREKTMYWAAIVVALVIAGGYLRTHSLDSQSYWMDEGFTVNAVLSVLERGDTILDSGKHYSCPTYCYPTGAIAKLFGENAFSYRLLAALAGTTFIAVIFFIARNLFTLPVALLASLFTAFSYYQIAWSRQARWYTLFELFFWLALFFFYKALYDEKERSRIVYALLAAAATALAILTHGLGYLLPLIFAAWLLLDGFLRRGQRPRRLLLAAILFGIASLFLLTDSGASFLSKMNFFWGVPYYVGFYLFTYWLFVVLAAVALLQYKTHARATGFFVLSLLAYTVPLMLMTEIINYRYLFHLTPALFMLAAVGTEALRAKFKSGYIQASVVAFVLIVFFTIGGGILTPQSFYLLEADDPELYPNLSYWAYTPQPDWNSAYTYIAEHREPGDIVISSMPQFNKIFLREPGYWIKYDYIGADDPEPLIENDREYYVGAAVVDNLAELQALAASHSGFIVFDYMATDGRIPEETLQYIEQNFALVFEKRENYYSHVWVYRF